MIAWVFDNRSGSMKGCTCLDFPFLLFIIGLQRSHQRFQQQVLEALLFGERRMLKSCCQSIVVLQTHSLIHFNWGHWHFWVTQIGELCDTPFLEVWMPLWSWRSTQLAELDLSLEGIGKASLLEQTANSTDRNQHFIPPVGMKNNIYRDLSDGFNSCSVFVKRWFTALLQQSFRQLWIINKATQHSC